MDPRGGGKEEIYNFSDIFTTRLDGDDTAIGNKGISTVADIFHGGGNAVDRKQFDFAVFEHFC